MESLSILNDKLDKTLTEKEKIEQEIVDILIPIRKILEENLPTLSIILPKNIEVVSSKKIRERLEILKEEIEISSIKNKETKIKIINQTIIKLYLLNKEEIDKKITELQITINQRKRFVEYKYIELKEIDINLKKSINNEEKEKLQNQKREILSDNGLYEDLKILYNYYEEEKNIELEETKKIITIDKLYELVNEIIKNKITEILKYRYLKSKEVEKITEELKNNVRGYIDAYIMSNRDLSSNIEEFKLTLNSLLKNELEDYFEIKNKLGSEYVISKEENSPKIITLKDVVEKKYTGFESSLINKYATILELSKVNENNLDIVRNFVINMGPEFVQIFDNLWIQEDIKRRTKILELKKKQAKIAFEIQNSIDYY